MRLNQVEMRPLLPTWMRGDAADLGLSKGVEDALRPAADKADRLTIWDKLDDLPDAYLDELAWSLDVDWYDQGADHSAKAEIIRQADFVHQKLGTVSAVESVISTYFRVGRVREWPEYGGLPHHFKVFTTDPSAVNDNLIRFLDLLYKVKRLSSVFDGVQIGLTGEQYAHCGMGVRDCSIRTVYLGVRRGSTVETVEANKAAISHTAIYRTIQLGAQAPGGE